MAQLTQDARRKAAEAAKAQGLGAEAGEAMLTALIQGGGRQAQFNHPELGGLGQWSGGMTQIGDMFNSGLKDRVAALAADLSRLVAGGDGLTETAPADEEETGGADKGRHGGRSGGDWPEELGWPSSTGSQNDMAYAVFPDSQRLAVREGGRMRIYDTGDHRIGGVAQSQSDRQSLTFSSQQGLVRLEDLRLVSE